MMYPGNIVGPRIDQGDLVSLIFDGAELTFRLPVIPNNPHNANIVSSIRDFRGINSHNWDRNDKNLPLLQFVVQSWCFEDDVALIDVAAAELYLGVLEVSQLNQEKREVLNFEKFKTLMFSGHAESLPNYEEIYLNDSSWPALANRFNEKVVERKHLNWYSLQMSLLTDARPCQIAMIPINNRFILAFSINLTSLHYPDIKNPYSEETLKQFEFDLFDEFLSHIDLRYSPETIATINALKTQ
jgi:hypothetical protein